MMVPTLACAATANMSRMERDCCREMHGVCGNMAKQACCQIDSQSDLGQLPTHPVTSPVVRVVVTTVLYPAVVRLPACFGTRWHVPDEHSPPGLLIASSTVLRT